MSTLCTVTGTTLDVQGTPIPGVKIFVVKVTKSGAVIKLKQKTVDVSDNSGLVSFELPKACTAWIEGAFYVGSTNCSVKGGVPFDIPNDDTVALEDLGASVAGPTKGVTWQIDDVTQNGLITTFNFVSPGIVATSTVSGVLNISVPNVGSGGVTLTVVTRQTPTPAVDGSQTAFTLAALPIVGSEEVFLDGVLQEAGVDYTIAGAVITMTVAPDALSRLRVNYRYDSSQALSSFTTRETPTPPVDDVTTVFTLVASPLSGSEEVFLDGVLQESGIDYTIAGATITMTTAPDSLSALSRLRVNYRYDSSQALSSFTTRETPTPPVDDVTTVFTLAASPLSGSEEIFLDGVLQESGVDYTIAGATITMTTAPDSLSRLRVSYRT